MPKSVKNFSVLYLAGLILSIVAEWLFFDSLLASFINDPDLVLEEETVSTLQIALIVTLFLAYAISIVLWACVTSLRSRIAKWALVLLALLMVAGVLIEFWDYSALERALYLSSTVLQCGAVLFLFRKDARYWLAGRETVDVGVFE